MKLRVYIETTIPSYLTAWQSPQLVMAANQQLTREWWDERRDEFDLFCSELVVEEVSGGDPNAAARRLTAIDGIPLLETGEIERELARAILIEVPFPSRAAADALHIAIAATNEIDYLLTWNCTHIANAEYRDRIASVCQARGVRCPTICTPQELLVR